MIIVVDASVAFKWFAAELDRDKALKLLQSDKNVLIAPELIVVEVLSAFWKATRRGLVEQRQAYECLGPLQMAFRELVPSRPLAKRAAEVSFSIDHPVYDAFYIALAEEKNCAMITADERLLRKTRGTVFSKRVQKLS